ncbi:hypothetical protein IF1G_07764 [Cordyceps javanica]|uniref:Uncharacterized protein n=1 Tax=Cordyceps javanica TaxID=43265 RepID=A0A545UUQ1_9HYPO|nr:hypothetical protein IF1G_07764 [Cordyceps javanica]
MASISSDQSYVLTSEGLNKLMSTLWPTSNNKGIGNSGRQAYMLYVEDHLQCDPTLEPATKEEYLSKVVHFMNCYPTTSKTDLIQQLKLNPLSSVLGNDDTRIAAVLELVARLWLMINVRTEISVYSIDSSVPWPLHCGIADVIKDGLGYGRFLSQGEPRQRFPKDFTLNNLECIGGFKICWTNNILEHLALRESDCIYIFYHVSILRWMEESVRK